MAMFQFISCFFYGFGVVLVIFEKGQQNFVPFRTFMSFKGRKLSFRTKTSINDQKSIFAVLYWLLLLVSEEMTGLSYAQCQRPLQNRVERVDLRLLTVPNGVISLYRGCMSILQFLYNCFDSFQSFFFFPGISHFLLFSPILQVCGRVSVYQQSDYQCISNQIISVSAIRPSVNQLISWFTIDQLSLAKFGLLQLTTSRGETHSQEKTDRRVFIKTNKPLAQFIVILSR